MTFEHRPLTQADTAAWSALAGFLADADDTDERYAPEDLAEELEEPGFTPELDSIGVWDAGTLVGFGQLRVSDALRDGQAKARAGGGVHPGYRGRGIGRGLMDRMEHRARELAARRHPGAPVVMEVWANAPGSSAARLADARGYEPARYFQDMRVVLADWDGPAGPPLSGTAAVPLGPDLWEGSRRAHNEAFADHWGSSARSAEKWEDMLKARSARPAFSRVVLDPERAGSPDDAVDSYLVSSEYVDGELHVALVGTRRRARGRGHAAAMLADVLGAAKMAGYRTVDLCVDSDNPTGAVGLYERAGFRRVRTTVVYQRAL